MASPPRTRLDELVVQRGLAPTRSAARGLIMAGLVLVDGSVSDKAGRAVSWDAIVTVKQRPRFVSRAGEKLAYALKTFAVEVAGRLALDVGASTGGFVDCLLQEGAARVIAVDVGHGQLDSRLRHDDRVLVLERTNARYLKPAMLPFVPDLLTMDVSFISVAKVLPAVMACMSPICQGLILIKPQFEAGPRQVGKGGIVRDPAVHREVLLNLTIFVAKELNLELLGVADSGLPGADGNLEYFFHIGRGGEKGYPLDTLGTHVDAVIARTMNTPTNGEA
ncbi:MAG: TlyA family RNA methyltransferase [Actinobacteria bacterium]|nr:TlyA family RNA methyltransferase [Actinomycetota bacterium]